MLLRETKDTPSLSEGLLREMDGFGGENTALRHRTKAYILLVWGKQGQRGEVNKIKGPTYKLLYGQYHAKDDANKLIRLL